MVVRKAVKMANQLNVPILGVVENMSYLRIPETGRKIDIFGPSRGDEMAKACDAPFLGQIPLDPELAKLCDEGRIESYDAESTRIFRQSVITELLTGHVAVSAVA